MIIPNVRFHNCLLHTKNNLTKDGLVNNGGGQFWAEAQNISPNGFNAVVDTNLNGTWNCIQEAFHQYMGENGGNIVNIVLISSMGMAGQSHSGYY